MGITDTSTPTLDILASLDSVPVDHSSVPQTRLDLVNRYRTSPFPWRGQFSPQLIEVMLTRYAPADGVVGDPFVGSGTTLFESARRSLNCIAGEINPAAVLMARTVQFVSLGIEERRHFIRAAGAMLYRHFPIRYEGGLFSSADSDAGHGSDTIQSAIRAVLSEATCDQWVYSIVANTIMMFMEADTGYIDGVFKAFNRCRSIVEHLPYNQRFYKVFHQDARRLSVRSNILDLIITSPPYINVFNYHQNYRRSLELMGWDMLRVAKSEIGSNRKNRGNRFLTTVQYCIDMLQALQEMRRLIREDGRVIIVIGRESTVRGVAFRNGRILAALAGGGAGLRLDLRQERKFKNRFGETIHEDILHFIPCEGRLEEDEFARSIAVAVLREAYETATGDVRADILCAMEQARTVRASPLLSSREGEIDVCHASPG